MTRRGITGGQRESGWAIEVRISKTEPDRPRIYLRHAGGSVLRDVKWDQLARLRDALDWALAERPD